MFVLISFIVDHTELLLLCANIKKNSTKSPFLIVNTELLILWSLLSKYEKRHIWYNIFTFVNVNEYDHLLNKCQIRKRIYSFNSV